MTNPQNFPNGPGSYALLLFLDRPQELQIGRLRPAQLPSGVYIYLGSAWGPGGLRARLNHHLCGQGSLHWHIDYLRRKARVVSVYTLSSTTVEISAIRLECLWSQTLANLDGAFCPVPGFGASDCRASCPAHLIVFKAIPEDLAEVLARAAGVSSQHLQVWPLEPAAQSIQPGVR
jgi:Uri superfamily endonuclease